jgi:hypothetical protein
MHARMAAIQSASHAPRGPHMVCALDRSVGSSFATADVRRRTAGVDRPERCLPPPTNALSSSYPATLTISTRPQQQEYSHSAYAYRGRVDACILCSAAMQGSTQPLADDKGAPHSPRLAAGNDAATAAAAGFAPQLRAITTGALPPQQQRARVLTAPFLSESPQAAGSPHVVGRFAFDARPPTAADAG